MSNKAIILLCIAISVFSGIIGWNVSAGNEDLPNKGIEHINLEIGCKCGNSLVARFPVEDEFWPLEFTCAGCGLKYEVRRDILGEEITTYGICFE